MPEGDGKQAHDLPDQTIQMDPPVRQRDESPHPSETRSSVDNNEPGDELTTPSNTPAPSRGSLLFRRRTDDGRRNSNKKNHEPLMVYQPPSELPSAEEITSSFKERLTNQRQTTYSPADVDSLELPEIINTIEKHDVTFINTQTGSGKSTLVPKAIMEAHQDHRVVTTQPRRTATIRLAETVAGMCGGVVGESDVGYWIRGDRRGSKHTRLWYMTSYTLLLQLLNSRMAPPFSHIIIDEFHERQPEIEVLVALLRLLLQKPRGKHTGYKLILMSATINTEQWESYFSGLSVGLYSNDKQRYVIHNYHLEEASLLTGSALRRPPTFKQTVVNPEMNDNGMYICQQLIKLLVAESQLSHSILVFLPGRAAVSKMRRWLMTTMGDRLHAIPWHGSVELSWIQKQISQQVSEKQKIYLATDVAEVSVTLPDVVFVIDTCLVKRPYIDNSEPSTILYPQLVQQWTSKGSASQRQGRVGRTQQGFYFSLLPQEYAEQLEDYPTPPICHSRLDDLTLHLLHICASPNSLFSLCKRPPLEESLRISIRALLEIGAIMPSHVEDGTLAWSKDIMESAADCNPELAKDTARYAPTFMGLILQRLPVGTQAGSLVFYGLVLGLETLTMICAAIVQTAIPFVTVSPQTFEDSEVPGGSFEATAQSKERTHRSLEFFCRTSESDLIACVVVYLEWKRRCLAHEEVTNWSEEMCVSLERLVAIDELVVHLHNEIRAYFPCQAYITSEDGITDAVSLQKQLKVHQPIILWLICATYSSNAVQVRQVRNESRRQQRESGVPLFLQRNETYPDHHIPSVVCPWRLGQVVVPVTVSVSEGRNNVSVQQTMASSNFLLLLTMLYPVVRYSSSLMEDAQGTYRAFGVTINGVTRRIRCPANAAAIVLDFRTQFCNCVSALKHRRQHKHMDDVSFVNYLQEQTQDSMGGCFSLLRARVDLMTHLWNAMRDPTSTPSEMLTSVTLDERHVLEPTTLFNRDHIIEDAMEQFQYPQFMHDWGAAAAAAQAQAQAQQAQMPTGLMYPQASYGIPFPQSMVPTAAGILGIGGMSAQYLVNASVDQTGQYVQPHQPMPPDGEPPARSPKSTFAEDGYAAFSRAGPLVEDSSDDEA